nr:hypothetical protein [uncultured Psychrobacter sp.]
MHKAQHFLDLVSSRTSGSYLYQLLSLMGFVILLLVSNFAVANPFATPDNFDAASCPIGHKKYTIANTASTAPSLSSWVNGERSRTFTFNESSGNKAFTINFPLLIDANNSNGTVPFYGSINDATSDAINLVHNSTRVQTDHSLELSVNRPVSKVGYKIQDLDSNSVTRIVSFFPFRTETRIPYIEQVDVSADNGRLTFNDIFHNINAGSNIVTAKDGENCSTGQCTIDATWGYQIANKTLNLAHSNEKRETSGSHATGYSDFYFCLAPPKVLVKKVLAGNRVNDSDTNRDQFELSINRGTTVVNAVTTTGSGSAVTNNNNRNAVSIAENTSYTITEKVINGANGTTLANIANYNATYTCNNATTGSTTNVPSGTMTYNAAEGTRSFILDNTAYGDEITCTITNSPNYVFSGIVFNDNGGIAASSTTRQDISSTFTGNPSYFNAAFDSATESGIYDASMSIRLTDCNGTNITTTSANPQPVSNIQATRGRYNFTVPASALTNRTRVCVVQNEPSAWDYTVDTTPDKREVTLVNGVFDYKTESNGSRNLDFGEVRAENAALVLIKSQYVHECNDSLNYQSVGSSENPTLGFSINPISDVDPGNCIAYRIQAYNRGHIGLQQVQISDTIQSTPVVSVFKRPAPLFIPTSTASPSVTYDTNSTILSNLFSLVAASNTPTLATLYFNTKYGTTQSN